MKLPDFFVDFLNRNNLSRDVYDRDILLKIPRSFIINKSFSPCTHSEILDEFPDAKFFQLSEGNTVTESTPIDHPRGDNALFDNTRSSNTWYEMDPSINVGSSTLFKEGKLLFMDFSSVFSIFCLQLKPDDHFLDMCCAPGLKLSLAAIKIGNSGTGSVTGVDISTSRLNSSVSLIKKFKIPKCRLFKADSSDFDIGISLPENHISALDNFTRKINDMQAIKPFYSTSQYRKRICYHQITPCYDKIVLDSQCTHDGSIKHIFKSFNAKNISNLNQHNTHDDATNACNEKDISSLKYLWSVENENNTISIQKALLKKAFSLLKVNGTLLYCTCRYEVFIDDIHSRTESQNEAIIREFLSFEANAIVLNVSFIPQLEVLGHPVELVRIRGESEFAVKFNAKQSRTNGFFICLLSRK